MFGPLRYNRTANGKEPERQKERTLEHAQLKTRSQQTPVKVCASARDSFHRYSGFVLVV
jgi:hypothetical protein